MRRDGTPAWVLVHLEIQSQRDPAFPERMLFYHVRLMDRERLPVVSLAVLGDDQPAWRPDQLNRHLWGCDLTFRFPTVKLLDYDPAVQATLTNPFATVTLMHRDAQETRGDPEERLRRKVVRYRALLRQGYQAADIRLLLRLMEHLLRLQPELARQARDAMRQVEQEELGMETFVTSFEEIGREEGQRELVLRLLTRKVGPLSATVQAQVTALSGEALLDLSDALLDFTQAADLTTWLDQHGAAATDDAPDGA
ncbi:DUF4351 domain-containing protein [Candidatus Chloroploca sp. Khr17]|uniref:DUF4351 domain-containing protein n=1 Tax=Candidatus Chloroploca sp. Khr17 TaxID=2496869 RepID=UPI00101B8C23|nr:DUF4351 domain-containing protein [Candidatus Chloroploca sp. Khr17]